MGVSTIKYIQALFFFLLFFQGLHAWEVRTGCQKRRQSYHYKKKKQPGELKLCDNDRQSRPPFPVNSDCCEAKCKEVATWSISTPSWNYPPVPTLISMKTHCPLFSVLLHTKSPTKNQIWNKEIRILIYRQPNSEDDAYRYVLPTMSSFSQYISAILLPPPVSVWKNSQVPYVKWSTIVTLKRWHKNCRRL